MGKGKIILLNGVSSSGKSTLARELVNQLDGYFHLSIDDYDGFIEKAENRETGHLIPVPTEFFYHRTIAMFSDLGVNVIADQILHDVSTTKDCFTVLQRYPVFFVGVHCPPPVLQQRESQRGDRPIGLAEIQLNFIHQQRHLYHLEVNTYKDTIANCAKQIQNALQEHHPLVEWAIAEEYTQAIKDV
ncbi:chloramphenicol phosphotransferase CPT family protein [Planomicrobium okeanokoites]|uniref:Chloramphenicol phosphotransferase CPT family protein n=1 Tax=Planomicrobium okeanokoites TaxID=244 RepID=A0ABV7KJH9_PLAOK|nr:AAA family ATPase [Planomicrobium okeanokoites]TAA68966.1 chloramphenicol phosphotransferase [Planomicrobium okeanokoites]